MANEVVSYSDVERMAEATAKSGLFGLKTKEQAIALMAIAQAEGLHPATAARDYHIINGRPTLKADAMLARFLASKGKVQWTAYADEKVAAIFSHPDGGSVEVEWTLARAKQAELGGNGMWKKYPRQMLRARVVSEGIRTVCPGVAVGIYTPEEAHDMAPAPTASRPDDIVGEVVSEDDLLRRDLAVTEFRDALEADVEEEQKAAMVFAIHSKHASDEPFYRLMWAVLGSRERSAIKAYVTQAKASRETVLANGRAA